ncbi:MPN domain-containing protein [Calycomorphotria hydatis]|uniref:JAB domain-containing protein n=1 Tax=Calycomorphotria hydatis TaxID=2528027 RepID=A0A517TE62_9PLAN|nr:hypothetical protein [Calycomorphotria hydatis]QDT66652.1 hypothetical protein V22_39230 [Calycomorphotria hydatis]
MKRRSKLIDLSQPVLRFTPYAWAKLLFLREAIDVEVSGFGITSPEDLLFVEEIFLVPQTGSVAFTSMDDGGVADYFDTQVELGRNPAEFGRIWIHTHPGRCPQPSGTDEETFQRCFGGTDWAVMFILAEGEQSYGRLRVGYQPGFTVELCPEISFENPFEGCEPEQWQHELDQAVRIDGHVHHELWGHETGELHRSDWERFPVDFHNLDPDDEEMLYAWLHETEAEPPARARAGREAD